MPLFRSLSLLPVPLITLLLLITECASLSLELSADMRDAVGSCWYDTGLILSASKRVFPQPILGWKNQVLVSFVGYTWCEGTFVCKWFFGNWPWLCFGWSFFSYNLWTTNFHSQRFVSMNLVLKLRWEKYSQSPSKFEYDKYDKDYEYKIQIGVIEVWLWCYVSCMCWENISTEFE